MRTTCGEGEAGGLEQRADVLEDAARLRRAMSPSTMRPVAGSSGTWPETNSSWPARSAAEYGPIGFGRERAGDRLLQAALVTLPERRQRVQTRIRLMPPLIIARTV